MGMPFGRLNKVGEQWEGSPPEQVVCRLMKGNKRVAGLTQHVQDGPGCLQAEAEWASSGRACPF